MAKTLQELLSSVKKPKEAVVEKQKLEPLKSL
jgi:hypothetical protein